MPTVCRVLMASLFILPIFAYGGGTPRSGRSEVLGTRLAQAQGLEMILPSVNLNGVEIREALRTIMKPSKVSYTVSPVVKGKVTVSLSNVSVESALQRMVRQIEATYRVEGGVISVVPREDPQGDPAEEDLVSIQGMARDVDDVINEVVSSSKKSYIVDSRIQGKISVYIRDIPREKALAAILHQINAVQVEENGIVRISPAPVPKPVKPVSTAAPRTKAPQ